MVSVSSKLRAGEFQNRVVCWLALVVSQSRPQWTSCLKFTKKISPGSRCSDQVNFELDELEAFSTFDRAWALSDEMLRSEHFLFSGSRSEGPGHVSYFLVRCRGEGRGQRLRPRNTPKIKRQS